MDSLVIICFLHCRFLSPIYSGNYGDAITVETLKDFHRRRVQVLVESAPDLIAFETIPNKIEAQVLAKCL